MAEMEFLQENILNTTTMVEVDSNTSTAQNLFDRNLNSKYTSDGYNSTTSTTIRVILPQTTTVSHVLIQNHNLKSFNLYYDTAAAANSISASTTNSATSTYLSFSTISAKEILLVMNDTIAGSVEKSLGELVVTERDLVYERNPNAKLYNPLVNRTQVKHKMPDGGMVLYNVKDKERANIGLRFITPTFHNSLKAIYSAKKGMYFVPFPTTTAWGGEAFSMVWSGNFDFKFGDNAKNTYSGNILLEETISGG